MIHKQYNEIMANSKKKGNRFELKVSKWFTEWTSFKFGRTPYSGANHQSRDLSSDIMCQDERHAHRCKISVECKNYKVPQIPAIFIEKDKPQDNKSYLIEAYNTILNIPQIQDKAYSSGFFNNIPDDTGIIRSVPIS